MHEEASAVFYGQSVFSFKGCVSETTSPLHGTCWHIEPFLSQIGRNVRHVRNIDIILPSLDRQSDGRMAVSRESTTALAVLAQRCFNVRTIHTSLCNTRFKSEDPYQAPPTDAELDSLNEINDLFRGFKALEEIIVEHYQNTGLQDELLRRIAPFGWTMVSKRHPVWFDEDNFRFCGGVSDSEEDESD
jgi:hypothetical protein